VSVVQAQKAEKIVMMPLWALSKLANKVGHPMHKEKYAIHHTGRCGSTLLCQIFWRLPQTIVLSDPFPQHFLLRLYHHGLMSKEEVALQIRNTLRLQGKPMLKVEEN